jgi:hypothetical protein
MQREHKYAKIERERRCLLSQFPSNASVVRIRRITDRYIDGTALRSLPGISAWCCVCLPQSHSTQVGP